ncbi:MAG: site-2 protease family protein, partial [Leptolyngbya sp. SIO1D8]|nr:site-2 protease family protein [Leptolyngbya sp. SIO1D8]
SRDRWETTTVGDVMNRSEALTQINADESLLNVVKLLEEQKLSVLAVRRENGTLLGLLEKQSVLALLRHKPQSRNVSFAN